MCGGQMQSVSRRLVTLDTEVQRGTTMSRVGLTAHLRPPPLLPRPPLMSRLKKQSTRGHQG